MCLLKWGTVRSVLSRNCLWRDIHNLLEPICKTGLSTELDGKQILPEHADASGKGPEVRAAPRSE